MGGLIAGHHNKRIVGRGVAIYCDAVERPFCQFVRQSVHEVGVDAGIGSHKAQHGGHIGANHAGPFTDTGDGHSGATHLHLGAQTLGQGVGGHDAFCRTHPVVGLRIGQSGRQTGFKPVHGQGLHDHAGRKRQYLLGLQRQMLCQSGTRAPCMGQTRFTGACIGVAGVDDQGTNARLTAQMFATHLNRCGTKTVGGEDATYASAFVQQKNGEVFAIRLFNTGFCHPDAHTRNG